MKRIALITTCLLVLIAGMAVADEITIPLNWAIAAEVQGRFEADSPEAAGARIPLPRGVETIEAVMEQNAIRVIGTAEGIAELRGMIALLDHPLQGIEVATTWLYVHDPDALPSALITEDMATPKLALIPRMTEDEVAALLEAGTVLNEPRVILANGRPGKMAFKVYPGENAEDQVSQSVGLVAQVNPDDTILLQLDIGYHDSRPEAEQEDVSLQAMVRVADGETVLLARVGEDGAILNPVYLLTARVVED